MSNKIQYFEFQSFYPDNVATNNIYYTSVTSSRMPLLAASKPASHHSPSVWQKDKEEAFSNITAASWNQTRPEMFVRSDVSHKPNSLTSKDGFREISGRITWWVMFLWPLRKFSCCNPVTWPCRLPLCHFLRGAMVLVLHHFTPLSPRGSDLHSSAPWRKTWSHRSTLSSSLLLQHVAKSPPLLICSYPPWCILEISRASFCMIPRRYMRCLQVVTCCGAFLSILQLFLFFILTTDKKKYLVLEVNIM